MVAEKTAGPIAIVTGGTRGIGAAVARCLAAAGYSLCLGFRDDEAAASNIRSELMEQGTRVITVQADLSHEQALINLFEQCDSQLGRLDALVNNAAIVGRKSRLEDFSAERVQAMFTTNVVGTVLCCREAVKRMSQLRGGEGGAIVNVSSVAARLGSAGEYIDYAASKGAIDTLTIGLSQEVAAEGIRVNAVRPGITNTDMHASGGQPDRVARLANKIPMQRGGEAEEIAAAITWLLSAEASYTTGALLDVAGGR